MSKLNTKQRSKCMPSHETLLAAKNRYKMPARYSPGFGISCDLAAKAGSGNLTANEESECDRQIEASMAELRDIYVREQSASRPHVKGETHIRVVHVPKAISTSNIFRSDHNYHGSDV